MLIDKIQLKQERFKQILKEDKLYIRPRSFYQELLFANAPNNRQLAEKLYEKLKGKMWFVVFRGDPLLLFLGRVWLGLSLEGKRDDHRKQVVLNLYRIPRYQVRGQSLEFVCYEPNCKAKLIYYIERGETSTELEDRVYHRCFIKVEDDEELHVLDYADGNTLFRGDKRVDLDAILRTGDPQITNRCISLVKLVTY